MQQAATYQERSRAFLAKAYAELDEDLAQASEKGWGAASAIVKAAAVERGWRHRSHRALHEVVNALIIETGDTELGAWFNTANGLHMNFYENWSTRTLVELGIKAVEQFVDKVEALLPSNS